MCDVSWILSIKKRKKIFEHKSRDKYYRFVKYYFENFVPKNDLLSRIKLVKIDEEEEGSCINLLIGRQLKVIVLINYSLSVIEKREKNDLLIR